MPVPETLPPVVKLLRLLGPPLGRPIDEAVATAQLALLAPHVPRSLVSGLAAALARRNGAFGFENALVMFGLDTDPLHDLVRWNSADGWRSAYGDLADGLLFFAIDGFGGPFALAETGIVAFDPETGETSLLASDMAGWAQALLSDYEVLTGHPLVREWQRQHRALQPGERLVPIKPFVLGGPFALENLKPEDAWGSLVRRASLACAIRTLPDGGTISWPLEAT